MTRSLLQLEKEFGKYQSTINSKHSVEYKLITLIFFWNEIKASLGTDIYQLYIQVYRQDFIVYVSEKNLLNITIEELIKLKYISNTLNLSEQSDIIAKRIITLLCYVGDLHSVLETYNEHLDTHIKLPDTENDNTDSVLLPFERLNVFIKTISEENQKAYQFFSTISNEWETKTEQIFNNKANCIVVEKTDLYQRGKLCQLECEVIISSKRNTNDQISLNDELKTKNDPFVEVIYNSIDTIKLFFNQYQGKFLHVFIKIINNRQKVTGDSIGIAVVSVIYTNLIKDEVHRYERFLSGEVVFTGSLDDKGNILPINEETLSCKIERIFFSHINYLVIPEGNYEKTKQILKELKNKYPLRKLTIYPIEHFSETLRSKDIIRSEKLCPLEYITKQTIKYSRKTKVQVPLLMVLILLLTAILFPKFMPWFDWHIASIVVEGNRFKTVNEKGQTIWWSEPLFYNLIGKGKKDNSYKKDCFYAFDSDNNGKDELFFVPNMLHREGVIQYYNDQGKLIWEEFGYESLFFPKQIVSKFNSAPNILPLGSSGPGYIITESWLMSEPLCWQQFQLYNKDGKVGGVYIYPGVAHFVEPYAQFADIDNDSINEFLVGGTSINGNGSGVIILNPYNLFGVAPPYNKNFIESGLQKGSQKYFISIPKTPLCYDDNIKNDLRLLQYNDITDRIVISVFEGINLYLNKKRLGPTDDLPIMEYEFDENFIPLRVRLTDASYPIYNNYWHKLGNKGSIDFGRLFDSLKSEVIVYKDTTIIHHLAAGIDFYKHSK